MSGRDAPEEGGAPRIDISMADGLEQRALVVADRPAGEVAPGRVPAVEGPRA